LERVSRFCSFDAKYKKTATAASCSFCLIG
jgi:hypothetical protein